MKIKTFRIIVAFLIFILTLTFFSPYKKIFAAEEEVSSEEEEKHWIVETGFNIGFNEGRLKRNKKLQSLVFSFVYGVDMMPLLEKIHIRLPGKLQFNYGPFLNPIIAPENNVEYGVDMLIKYSFPLFEKIWPFFEFGNGLIYTTQHTPEQSTQWNFLVQGGGGLSFFIKENVSINTTFRYRHYSNRNIKLPNRGIDSKMYLIGMSFHR